MSRPADTAALLLIDPHSGRLALGRDETGLVTPMVRPARGDGAGPVTTPALPQTALGAPESRTAAFQDASLRALFECLGQLVARPGPVDAKLTREGGWGRIARHQLVPDRGALVYLGRAIDPVDAPHRRHVRVFTAPLSAVSNSIKRRGRCERLVWLDPAAAEHSLDDPALTPFLLRALQGAGTPALKVTFRAGHRLEQPL
ncbi:hypothetical protein L2D00_01010 [Hyphomonadaceae bacterium BL14]|nr:hypothetical protein L2D00_01010 [Hyphomonadaceae bacterium BL14]